MRLKVNTISYGERLQQGFSQERAMPATAMVTDWCSGAIDPTVPVAAWPAP
jgi:hypothetical protein